MGNTSSLSIDSLASLYESGISAYKLAKDNGCSIWSIITRLNKANVKIRPGGISKNLNLDSNQLSIFNSLNTGLLLGDASIDSNKNRNYNPCFLRMEQSNIRLEWLKQIYNIYTSLGVHVNIIPLKIKKKHPQIEGRIIHQGPSSLLYTGISNEFRELRAKWYPNNGKKIVPKDIKLDALSIAMWFCGDGSAGSNGSIAFYTNGFIKSDVEFLCEQLMNFEIITYPRINHRGEWIVHTNGKESSIKLRDLIIKYLPDCCFYKLNDIRKPIIKPRKLTPDNIRFIRISYESKTLSSLDLALMFKISRTMIYSIIHSKVYSDVKCDHD